jgi:hypothetical protein
MPSSASVQTFIAAKRTLDLSAMLLPHLFVGFTRTQEPTEIVQIQDKIGEAFKQLEATQPRPNMRE